MKLNPISLTSFTSTYKVNLSGNTYKALNLYDFQSKDCFVHDREFSDPELLKTGVYGEIVVDAKDSYDKDIEEFLNINKLPFTKVSADELLKPESFVKRFYVNRADMSMGCKPVFLNLDKFDPLFSMECDYIPPFAEGKNKKKYKEAIELVQSGRKIEMPRMNLEEVDGILYISLTSGKYDYAAMRDLGLKYFPFAMTDEAKHVAKRFDLT